MAISFALFFLLYGDVEIPEINILGNQIVFGEADKLQNILIIVWLYFYYRYYVYFKDIRDGGYSGNFHGHLENNVKKEILEKVKDIPNATHNVNIYYRYKDYWTGKVELGIGDSGLMKQTEDIKIEGWLFLKCKIKAHLATFFKTRYFTEYGLPFFVGLTPLLVLAHQRFF